MQIPLPVRPIDFNPRSPCGERQLPALQRGTDGHFNPRSPCGERHFNDVYSVLLDDISIHAPRVGSDLTNGVSAMSTPLFQSTLPVWGATSCAPKTKSYSCISIHAPRVGSDLDNTERGGVLTISIHAPRVGSDVEKLGSPKVAIDFNPRSPCGERQKSGIHKHHLQHFNPRSPCGERRRDAGRCRRHLRFQSTLPVWGATGLIDANVSSLKISIHAPRVGSDTMSTGTTARA